MEVYTADAVRHGANLSRGGLLLIALMCGGDYGVSVSLSHCTPFVSFSFLVAQKFIAMLDRRGSRGVVLMSLSGCRTMDLVIGFCRQP